MRAAIQTFPSRDALMRGAADRIEEAIHAGIGERGAACVALSGGSTPAPAYQLLARRGLDWSKVTVALADERCVGGDDPASNEGLLRGALAPALAQGARLAPMYASGAPVAAALAADVHYAKMSFDIALLGMGEDGHTLSWFAGADGLDAALDLANPRSVVALHAAGAAGAEDRVSLTRSALARAKQIALVITGVRKFRVLSAAFDAAPETLPVAALFAAPLATPDVLWAV